MLNDEAIRVIAKWGELIRRKRSEVEDVAYFESDEGGIVVAFGVRSPLTGDPYILFLDVKSDPRYELPKVYVIPSPTKSTTGHGIPVIRRLPEPIEIGGKIYRDGAEFCPLREERYLREVRRGANGFDLIIYQFLRFLARCEGKETCQVETD